MKLWVFWLVLALEVCVPRLWYWMRGEVLAQRWIQMLDRQLGPRVPQWERMRMGISVGSLMLVAALSATIHPVLAAVVCWLTLEARTLFDQAIAAQRGLDSGNYRPELAGETAYDRTAMGALHTLARGFAPGVFLPLLLIGIGGMTSTWLPAMALWGYTALRALVWLPVADWLRDGARPLGRAAAWIVALTADVVGQHGKQARGELLALPKGEEPLYTTLLAALGLSPHEPHPRRPLSGDITQACLLLAVAVVSCGVVISVLLLLAG